MARSENSYYTDLRKDYPRTWRIWYRMNRRCETKQAGYVNVKVCEDWSKELSGEDGFINFVDCMGPSERELEIDRIDPFGDYEPGNCRWVTRKQQCNNMRKHNDGSLKWLQLAKKNGICYHTFYSRLERGWNPKDAASLRPSTTKYKQRII